MRLRHPARLHIAQQVRGPGPSPSVRDRTETGNQVVDHAEHTPRSSRSVSSVHIPVSGAFHRTNGISADEEGYIHTEPAQVCTAVGGRCKL